MPIEKLLEVALAWVGFLLTTIIGLLVFIFTSLKTEVKKLTVQVEELNTNRFQLVHKDECRERVVVMQKQIKEQGFALGSLDKRVTRVETQMEEK